MRGYIVHGDSSSAEAWESITDVALVVTSPPYNVGIDYDEHDDLMSPDEYRALIKGVFERSWDSLVEGGRMVVNVPNTVGRSPSFPLGGQTEAMLLSLPEAYYRGAIVWNKGAASGQSTAWGSWRSPSNPVLTGEHEMLYVVSKGAKLEGLMPDGVEFEMSKREFMANTKDVWSDVGTTSADRSGHPAAFPVTLAERLIRLYSYPGQKVVDPFFGSGTTGKAAEALNRLWVGIEMSESYCELAADRIGMFGQKVEIRDA